jgi:hypothetical protein
VDPDFLVSGIDTSRLPDDAATGMLHLERDERITLRIPGALRQMLDLIRADGYGEATLSDAAILYLARGLSGDCGEEVLHDVVDELREQQDR